MRKTPSPHRWQSEGVFSQAWTCLDCTIRREIRATVEPGVSQVWYIVPADRPYSTRIEPPCRRSA